MTEQKSLEQIIMDAIDFCTHTRCKKCEYYGKDSAHDYKGKCRGRMMADHLRKNGVVVREKGEWMEMVDSVEDGHTGEYYEEIYYNCLNCDYASDQNTNFCPNCGADMRKVENDG